jgi:type I restriction enzyme R subunit
LHYVFNRLVCLKYFKKKLPYTKTTLPLEIAEQISPEHIKIVKQNTASIWLTTEDGTLQPLQPGTSKPVWEDEKDFLSNIIQQLNDKYKTGFTEQNKVILNHLYTNIKQSPELLEAFNNKNNSKDHLKIAFKQAANKEQVNMIGQYTDFFAKLWKNMELQNHVMEMMFEFMYKNKIEK